MASTVTTHTDLQTVDANHGHRVLTIKTPDGNTIATHITLTIPVGRAGGQAQWLIDAETEAIRAMDAVCSSGPSAHRITSQ
jgi:hypothetical protein